MLRRLVVHAIFTLLVLLPGLACSDAEDTVFERASMLSSNYLLEAKLAGLSVTVGRGQSILWSKGFGLADLEQQVPVDPGVTRFRVGSTAKSMTAMAIAQLVEAGKLDLDTPIQDYLPDYPQGEGVITTRLLAGHLAGIRHYASEEEFLATDAYSSVTAGLVIFKDDPLLSLPGTEFHYSTFGFNLVSAVVERAANHDFLSYMEEYVFCSNRHDPDRSR